MSFSLKVEHGLQLLNDSLSPHLYSYDFFFLILVKGLNFTWIEWKAGHSCGFTLTIVTVTHTFASSRLLTPQQPCGLHRLPSVIGTGKAPSPKSLVTPWQDSKALHELGRRLQGVYNRGDLEGNLA